MKKSIIWISLASIALLSIACVSSISLPANKTQVESENLEERLPDEETLHPTVEISAPNPLNPVGNIQEIEDILIILYTQANPGIVSIRNLNTMGGVQGSGFVYDKEGHIITNFHVVEAAEALEVAFPSGQKVHATLIGTDIDSDLAILKVDMSPEDLTPLPIGNSDNLQVGQMVVAIGNPYGLSGTMTMGIISGKGRTLDSLRYTEDGTPFSAGDLIQTDALINPGNSGGPLLNLDGEVVGINRAIRTSGTTTTGDPVSTGIGFSISSNIIRQVVPYLIEDGGYDYPYVGMSALWELNLFQIEELGLDYTYGAYVVDLVPNGPAGDAGLRAGSEATSIEGLYSGGDLIIGVDGIPVRVFGEFLSYLLTSKTPGETITLTILRDNQEMEVELTLGSRP
ncbi:MAG: trypsin-like peptidase domain-containing protein [Anaerolineaceae bacterium]|nr:trypsin-like peptidase domain-containing protein [Anaerolineaceae bacterium]